MSPEWETKVRKDEQNFVDIFIPDVGLGDLYLRQYLSGVFFGSLINLIPEKDLLGRPETTILTDLMHSLEESKHQELRHELGKLTLYRAVTGPPTRISQLSGKSVEINHGLNAQKLNPGSSQINECLRFLREGQVLVLRRN